MARDEVGTVTKRSGGRRKVRWDSKTGEVWVEGDGMMSGWSKLPSTATSASIAIELAERAIN